MIPISISKGNSKMGAIPSISLPPGLSCKQDPTPPCLNQCYARQSYVQYPSTRRAWDRNFNHYKKDPADYFKRINGYLQYKQPTHFRWHVAGDIPDQRYLSNIIATAKNNNNTAFMCFTKQFGFDFSDMWWDSEAQEPSPSFSSTVPNLKIIFSRWPGDEFDRELRTETTRFPMAWMQPKDNSETRIPTNAFHCTGKCDTCLHCWSMAGNRHVFFNLH